MFFEDLNQVTVTGNLTHEVELRTSPGKTAVANIRIGVNGRRKEGGEWVDKPNFFTVTCFGKTAENAKKHLSKGRRILVPGRLDWSEWMPEGEEKKRQGVKIVAERLIYLPSKASLEAQAAEKAAEASGMPTEEEMREQAPVEPNPEPVAAGAGLGEEPEF